MHDRAEAVLEHVIDINASPPSVFELWTTTEGLSSWWGTAEADPRPGGTIRVEIDGRHVMRGTFVTLERPHLVVFTFGWEQGSASVDLPPGSSTVEVHIAPRGAGTRLTLRHRGLPIDRLDNHARGWRHFVNERLAGLTPQRGH